MKTRPEIPPYFPVTKCPPGVAQGAEPLDDTCWPSDATLRRIAEYHGLVEEGYTVFHPMSEEEREEMGKIARILDRIRGSEEC